MPFFIAFIELLGSCQLRSTRPTAEDFDAAAKFLVPRLHEGVRVVAAPEAYDPLVRKSLGKHLSRHQLAPLDLSRFETIYAVSVDGAFPRQRFSGRPTVEGSFGPLVIYRWDRGAPSPVELDLVSELRNARVELHEGGRVRHCRLTRPRAMPMRFGLSAPPVPPAERFICDPRRPEYYVGETIFEGVSHQPKRAIHQRPPSGASLHTIFTEIELSEMISLRSGLHMPFERNQTGAPYDLIVHFNGEEIGRMRYHDGYNVRELRIDTVALKGQRGELRVETYTEDTKDRYLGWGGVIKKRAGGAKR